MADEADRREAAGEPLVRHAVRREPGWSYLCPVPTCLRFRTGLDTERACRESWMAHAAHSHPALTPTWPDTSTIALPARRAHTRERAEPPALFDITPQMRPAAEGDRHDTAA